MTYKERQKVWLWPAQQAAWHFVSISKKLSKQLRTTYKAVSKGFGSLPVQVTIGDTTWDTSIFYDGKSAQYVLPLKAVVRKKEGIAVDDTVTVSFEIRG